MPTLKPRLVVADAAKAIEFYVTGLGADELSRYTADDGAIVHAELAVGDARFTLKDTDGGDRDPSSYGGTPVLLSLTVDDADAVGEAMQAAGAKVIFAIGDSPYGRMGRLEDPFGHVWMVSQGTA